MVRVFRHGVAVLLYTPHISPEKELDYAIRYKIISMKPVTRYVSYMQFRIEVYPVCFLVKHSPYNALESIDQDGSILK